jgi:hypothetical protein
MWKREFSKLDADKRRWGRGEDEFPKRTFMGKEILADVAVVDLAQVKKFIAHANSRGFRFTLAFPMPPR